MLLPFAPLALLLLLHAQAPPTAAEITFANALYRTDSRLAVTPMALRKTRLAGMCAALCSSYTDCVSVNYKVSTGECELLSGFLCQDEVTSLQSAIGWSYYDLESTQESQVFAPLVASELCQSSGICSTKCGRYLREPCSMDEQCLLGSPGTYYCTLGICSCQEDPYDYFPSTWSINSTTCFVPSEWYVPGSMRLYKKIWPKETCTIGMKIMSGSSNLTVKLITRPYIVADRYDVDIADKEIVLKEVINNVGTAKSTGSFKGLSHSSYTLFKMDWCDGTIRVGPSGSESLVSWTPTSGLLPLTHVLFDPQDFPESATEISANYLVDQWYPSGNLTSPRDSLAQIVRKFPDGPLADFELVFYCKGAEGCILEFYENDQFADGFRVCIGYDGDTFSVISIRVNDDTDDYINAVSNRVERDIGKPFWIQLQDEFIRVGGGLVAGQSPWSFASVQVTNETRDALYTGPGIRYAVAGGNAYAAQYYFMGDLSFWNGQEWGTGIP